jgi:Bcr/CflA subfamily drug resistance transporter
MNYVKNLPNLPSALILVLLVGYPQLSETIYTPSLPGIAKTLHTSESQVELTLGIYFLGFALGVLCWGTFSDRFGRRAGVICGLLVYTLSSLGCQFANTLEVLILLRLFQGFGASSGSVVAQTIIRDCFTGQERSRFFSLVGASLAAVPALGPLLGGTIDYYLSWRSDFTFLTILGVGLLGYVYLRLPETRSSPQAKVTFADMKRLTHQMIRDPNILASVCIIGTCNGIVFSYYGEGPFVFHEMLGHTAQQYSRFGVIISLASFLASVLSHRLNRTLCPDHIMGAGGLICSFGTSLLYVLARVSDSFSAIQITWMILGSMWIVFIGLGLVIPNCISGALSNYSKSIGTAGSLFGLAYYLLISIFTYGMAYFHDGSLLAMPRYLATLSMLLLAACAWKILSMNPIVKSKAISSD